MESDRPIESPEGDGHVFLSYCRSDSEAARRVVAALESRGVRVWWDKHLSSGAVFSQEIEQALRSSRKVLVLWSKASVQSDWVRDEAALARDLGLLSPAMLDDAKPPLGFGQYHAVDLSRWAGQSDAAELDALISAMRVAASASATTRAPTVNARARDKDRVGELGVLIRRRRLLLGAGVAALAGVGTVSLLGGLGKNPFSSPASTSVAVLPFENLSGDPSMEYVCDGLGEELISALARLDSLQVAGKISSFRFRKSDKSPAMIGASLGVAYLIDGTLHRLGDVLRMNVHLIEARTGFDRWSQTLETPVSDTLGLETRLSETVAVQLRGYMGDADKARLAGGRADRPEAFDAYLKGKTLFAQGASEADFRRALSQFEAAITAQPNFALARSFKARTLLTLGDTYLTNADASRRVLADALSSAEDAVAIAPAEPEVQATLADALVTVKLDLGAAKRAYSEAVKTGSGQAEVLMRFGCFAARTGDPTHGVAAAKLAVELDPLNSSAFIFQGLTLTAANDFEGAEKALLQALSVNPAAVGAHAALGDVLYFMGRLEAARREYNLEPDLWQKLPGLAIVLRALKDDEGASRAFKQFQAGRGDLGHYQEAQVYAQSGRREEAFAALNAAFRVKDSGLTMLKTDPFMRSLRSDARFAQILSKLNLS